MGVLITFPMRATPRFVGGLCGNQREPERGESEGEHRRGTTRRRRRLRVPVRRTTPVPRRPQLGASAPRAKRGLDRAPRVLGFSSCPLRGQCRLTPVGTLDPPGPSRRGPSQALFVDRSYVPLCGQPLLRAGPLAVRLSTRPHVDASPGRIQEVSYDHRVNAPCGP